MPRDHKYITQDYVITRLENAGRTLMMLPDRVRPTGYPSAWPQHLREFIDTIEVVQELNEKGEMRAVLKVIKQDAGKPKIRASMRQINEMNEVIFNWLPRLSAQCLAKKTPWVARCTALAILHHPDTDKRVWSWAKLAEHFKQKSRQTPSNWYDDGVRILTHILNS